MSLWAAMAIYFIIWWTVLFCVLPLNVQSQAEKGDVVAGSEPGAPAEPQLLRKAGLTTIVAAVVFVFVYVIWVWSEM